MLIPYHPAERPVETPPGFDGTFYPPGIESVPRRYAIVRANRYMVDHVSSPKLQNKNSHQSKTQSVPDIPVATPADNFHTISVLFLFLFQPSLSEPILRPNLQPHGQQAQCSITNGGCNAQYIQRFPYHSGIIKHLRCSQNHAHGGQCDTGKQSDYKGSVPVIKAINRKRRPPPE